MPNFFFDLPTPIVFTEANIKFFPQNGWKREVKKIKAEWTKISKILCVAEKVILSSHNQFLSADFWTSTGKKIWSSGVSRRAMSP
jgi:hypothetical protein